jgi:hypothetical protein
MHPIDTSAAVESHLDDLTDNAEGRKPDTKETFCVPTHGSLKARQNKPQVLRCEQWLPGRVSDQEEAQGASWDNSMLHQDIGLHGDL